MKYVLKCALMATVLTGFSLSAGTALAAEKGTNEFTLDEMVITATRTLKELKEVPGSVSVITAKELAEKNVSTVNEAIKNIPGMKMSALANYDSNEGMQLRGFSDTDILILVDGVQQNKTYNSQANMNAIPVESIERIEVLRGAASSIYGGHAVAGVVNIITKEHNQPGTSATAVLSYGSYNSWKKAISVASRVNDKLTFGLGFERRQTDGYAASYVTGKGSSGSGTYSANLKQLSDGKYILGSRGKKESENTAYHAYVKYNFDESKSLKYSYQRAEHEWGYHNAFSYVNDEKGNNVFSGTATNSNGKMVTLKASDFYGSRYIFNKDTHSLAYRDIANNFSATFSYANNKKNGDASATVPSDYTGVDFSGEGEYSDRPGKIYNLNVEKAWNKLGGRHTIVTGIDLKQEKMTQSHYYLNNWRNEKSITDKYAADSGKIKNYAIYLQDEYSISKPLSLYLGARLDHFEKGEGSFWNKEIGLDEKSKSETYNELSPKAAISYKADDNTNFYVSYGHSFNPPPMNKIYRYAEYSKYWYVPNPELYPEASNTLEIGMKKKLSENTNLSLSLFHIKTKDAITASGYIPGEKYKGKKVKKYINIDEETRKGVELELTHDFSKKYSAYVNYTWQEGEYKDEDIKEPFYDIPKHIFHLGANYNCNPWSAFVDCEFVSSCNSPEDPNGEYGAYEPYFLVNTGVNYKLSKGMTLQFKVNNLLNRDFYSRELTPGRVYTVGLRYSF